MSDNLQNTARLDLLHRRAGEVRHTALSHPGDLDGWRISRLMRDAATDAQADEAERQLRIWESSATSPACPMCGSRVDRSGMAAGPSQECEAHSFECRACSFHWTAQIDVGSP
jgi:hypothetical protein